MSRITVATADLRRALAAVAPHAAPDDAPSLHRVRLAVGEHNIVASATNGYSAGIALVSVEDHDGELLTVDLSPTDVKEVLALFKGSGKPGTEDEIGATLRLDTDTEHFRVTDTAGLFDGKSLQLPRQPVADAFPNLLRVAHIAMTRRERPVDERLVTNGRLLALFRAASAAYARSLALEMTGRNSVLVLSCGEDFLGLLQPLRSSDEELAQLRAWRQAWLRRIEEAELVPA